MLRSILLLCIYILTTCCALESPTVDPLCHKRCEICTTTLWNCSNAFIENIPEVLHSTVQTLDLSNNFIRSIDGPLALSGSLQLERVSFKRNRIKQVHPLAFISLNKVKILDLSYNEIESLDSKTFIWMENLKDLILHHNKFSLVENWDLPRSIIIIDLSSTNINSLPDIDWPETTHIHLKNNKIETFPSRDLLPLNHQTLDLVGNPIQCECQQLQEFCDSIQIPVEFTCAIPKGEVFSCMHPPSGLCPKTTTEEEQDPNEDSTEAIDEDYRDNIDPSILVIEEIDFIYNKDDDNPPSDERAFLDDSPKFGQMLEEKQDVFRAFFHQHSALLYLVAGILFLILLSQFVIVIYRRVNKNYEIYQAVDKNEFPTIEVK